MYEWSAIMKDYLLTLWNAICIQIQTEHQARKACRAELRELRREYIRRKEEIKIKYTITTTHY